MIALSDAGSVEKGILAELVAVPIDQIVGIAEEYMQVGRLPEAEGMLSRVLAVAPHHAGALHLSGLVAVRQSRFADAATLVEQAIAHGADTPLYYRNLCMIYERLGHYDEAVAAGQRAVALNPTDPGSYHNLTIAHLRRLDLDASIDCARRAITLDPGLPGAHFALAEALLLRGEFASGWEEYEWRFSIPGAEQPLPQSDRPHWDGTPMPEGRLLLVADQGYGDAIQFCRYIPWAAERCANIMVACSPELRPLLQEVNPGLPIFSRWELVAPYRAYCTLSGLPRLHKTTLANIPSQQPYLRAAPSLTADWSKRLDSFLPPALRQIGITWAGRSTHNNDQDRSINLAALTPLGSVPGIALVSLQKGQPASQIGTYYGTAPLLNLGSEINDFADTAAIIASLDLVVSVDTSVAHLAAAMGKPTWIMLPYAPDWRWMLNRNDSPWYPTVRLFRQPALRRWEHVVTEIAKLLGE